MLQIGTSLAERVRPLLQGSRQRNGVERKQEARKIFDELVLVKLAEHVRRQDPPLELGIGDRAVGHRFARFDAPGRLRNRQRHMRREPRQQSGLFLVALDNALRAGQTEDEATGRLDCQAVITAAQDAQRPNRLCRRDECRERVCSSVEIAEVGLGWE